MNEASKIEAYYEEEHLFKGGILLLRDIALKTKAKETFKWQSPVYTLHGKNVFWISRFKNHFSIGFFNGVFLKDPKGLLINAQKGKTQAMRHLKFEAVEQIDSNIVLAYIEEALYNQEKGLRLSATKEKKQKLTIPDLLTQAFEKDPVTQKKFNNLTPYKQREYVEYIVDAKQMKTKLTRLEKILPMINAEKGLNDLYRPKKQ